MPRSRWWRIVCLLLASALFAGACSSDDGGSESVIQEPDAESSPAADTNDAEGETPEEETPEEEPSAESESEAGSEPESAEEANFASFRGVTADTIKVGVAVADFDALHAAGLPNYQGDVDVAFQTFFDLINASGGIHGRMIEPVYAPFDFLSPISQDEACVKFAEDEEVFIVLYGLLAENNLCLTERYATMVMTFVYQSDELRERSGDTLWLQLEATEEARAEILGSVVAERGLLEGRNIGIFANRNIGGEVPATSLQTALAGLGYESEIYLVEAPPGDELAGDAEIEVLAERMNVEGVDFLFNLIGGGTYTEDLAAAGFRPVNTAFTNLDPDTEASRDPSLLEGAFTVDSVNDDTVWEDPDFRETCIAPILDANPDLTEEFSYLPDADQQAAGEKNWLVSTRVACNQTMLLKLIAEIAGADLTNDTFRSAVDELGPVDLHGYGEAHFRSDGKWDGLDEFYLQRFNVETGETEVVGDPIVVER